MISVRDLHKRFGATHAVRGISFEVARGEVVGFLGPNGAGKTTTIRVLTCFHPATEGSATIAGLDVGKQPVAVRRQIGYLPENVPLYPDLRVEEYLFYRAALKGVPRRQRRALVDRAMERSGVVEVKKKLVGHVSRGYRQRTGLADALVANPPILILDEPTSGLDPNQRRRIKQLVRDLATDHTILFSSHILAEVEDVSSRILLIHRGELRADGSAQDLVGRATTQRLCVEAHGTAAALRSALAGFDWLAASRCEEVTEPDGSQVARLRSDVPPGVDPRDAVFAATSAAGLRLRELRLELPSLEEYFYAMTEGSDRREERAAASPEAAAEPGGESGASAGGDGAGA